MPLYQITAPNGKTYQIEGPPGASDAEVAQAVIAQFPDAGVAPKSAPFSFRDLGVAGATGLMGAVSGISTGLFGAEDETAQRHRRNLEALQKQFSPERQAEMQRRAQLEKEAAKSGSRFEEVKTFLGGVAEAPLQSVAGALGSAVPAVAAGVATTLGGAPTALGAGITLGVRALIGAVQGAGEVKSSIYDDVYKALREQGMPEEQAKQEAIKAQEYVGENWGNILTAAGLGAVASGTGAEKTLTNTIAKKLGRETAEKVGKEAAEGFLKRTGKEALKEALPEGAQGGQQQYASRN